MNRYMTFCDHQFDASIPFSHPHGLTTSVGNDSELGVYVPVFTIYDASGAI